MPAVFMTPEGSFCPLVSAFQVKVCQVSYARRWSHGQLNGITIVSPACIHCRVRFLAPTWRQAGTKRDLLTGICIVANEQGNPERIARRDLCFRPIQFPELLKVLSTPKLRIEGPWSAEDTIVKRSPVSAPVGNGSRTKLFALKGQHNSTTQSPVANLGQGEQISAARGRTHQNRGTLFFQ